MRPPVATLPRPNVEDGRPRRVGIEVECGGLDEDRVAAIVAECLGGEVVHSGEYQRRVEGTRIGSIEILLDTALRDRAGTSIARAGLDLGRAVIPVEFVTEPILPAEIVGIDALCRALAEAGATGTQDGIALGFGLHLNVALTGTLPRDILPVLRAFALTEDWLRTHMGLDPSRRVLPFVDPYPAGFVDRLCSDAAAQWSMDDLARVYLDEAGSRNHALDLLPILKHLDPARVEAAIPAMRHKSGRPAWHYRLPDCRIDDPAWSIAGEWARWCRIERLAHDHATLARLIARWRAYRDRPIPVPGRWAGLSGEIVEEVWDA